MSMILFEVAQRFAVKGWNITSPEQFPKVCAVLRATFLFQFHGDFSLFGHRDLIQYFDVEEGMTGMNFGF
jgi:hypothetical protein